MRGAWSLVHRQGTAFFGHRGSLALDPYVQWVQNQVKIILFPYMREAPMYSQPTINPMVGSQLIPGVIVNLSLPQALILEVPKFVPIELYKQAKADSLKLELERQKKNMELSFADQEKRKLLHEAKLKDKMLEKHGLMEGVKRPRVEYSCTSNQTEALVKAQIDLMKIQQNLESLRVSKDKMQIEHKEEIKILKKQLREEESKSQKACKQQVRLEQQVQDQQVQIDELKFQLKKKNDQTLAADIQLKGRNAQLTRVIEELARLKAQFAV